MTEPKRIIALSEDVVGKIAAGEVVERPAAAIKELVENSIDAGATAVTVEIKEGGIGYFRVTDNGCGIAPNEIKMAFERHATSKIRIAEDLHSVTTLGFRGEALASVAAVAKVTCTTRTREQENGISATNVGGVFQDIRDAACPEGTNLVVKDLFFNTPVRLKFLKKPSFEAGLVSDLMMRLILSHPEVAFRFVNDGKTVYSSTGDGKLESAVYSIYGKEMLNSMRFIHGHMNGLIINGFVGIGDSARGNRSHQSFFINGRYLKSVLLSNALEAACRERVTIGHFPSCVLHIEMPFDLVDVNVHPNKLEVRFQNEKAVYEAVEALVRDKLTEDTSLTNIPKFDLNEKQAKPENTVVQTAVIPTSVYFAPSSVQKPVSLREGPAAISPAPMFVPAPVFSAYPDDKIKTEQPVLQPQQETIEVKLKLQILGVYLDTYILAQYGDKLLMIDQHALHERLLFDKMMAEYDKHIAAQALLVPQSISLTLKEMDLYLQNEDVFKSAGFEIAHFGENTFQIRAVPMILGQPQLKGLFTQILDALDTQKGLNTLEKRRDAILQQACKHAVKGGEKLAFEVIENLVQRMAESGITPTCPHGRPLVIAFSKTDVEKRFKRIQ